MSKKILVHASQLVTCSGFAPKRVRRCRELNVIEDGAVLMEDGLITAVGTTEELLSHAVDAEVIDCSGKRFCRFVDSHP